MANFLDKVQPKNKIQLKQLVDYAFKHNIYDLNFIDTSKITDMRFMFCHCEYFNQDISNWDVSSVTDMNSMFYGCESFNQDISGWDVSNVTDMSYMFTFCEKYIRTYT